MHFVVYVNGIVMVFLAALMGLDALFFRETAVHFLTSAVIVGCVGGLMAVATAHRRDHVHRLHLFLMTSSVWLMAALVGAIPLEFWGMHAVDAIFEAMSGITTTGSTVMSGLDQTPKGIIFWRALLQALGGVGFIVTGIAMLPFLKVGGMQLFRTESSDKGDKEVRNAATFASSTLKIYVGLIAICALLYLAGGMSGFDAITHAMTTLSTGGYSGYDASFGHFQSAYLQWVCTLFMLLGALPFAWYIRVILRRTVRSEQVNAMLISLTAVILPMSAWLALHQQIDLLTALRMVAFNVVSVVTTTGYATTDYTLWGPFAVMGFFILTATGGCTGSTAGGGKAMRWLIAARAIWASLKKVRSPHRVSEVYFEGRRVEPDVMSGVVSFLVFYAITFGLMSAALTMLGLDLSTATSGALTALANVGPGVGEIIGPAGNFATLSAPVKAVLTFGMYLGRLEMLTVFVLLTPLFWREVLVDTRN